MSDRKPYVPCSTGDGRPRRVVTEPVTYALKDPPGRMHTLPGRAVCPQCGREVGWDGRRLARHKEDT